jgi:hypothetical protein
MQTLPAAAVFGLLPVPTMPDNGSASLGAHSTATEDTDVSRPFRGQLSRSSRLGDHIKAWLERLEEQPVQRPHGL